MSSSWGRTGCRGQPGGLCDDGTALCLGGVGAPRSYPWEEHVGRHTHTPPRQPGGGVSRPSGRTGVTLLALMPNCNGRCLPQRRWSEGPSPSISLQHPMNLYLFQNKELFKALTGVAQWVGRHPINQKVSDSIPIRPHAWVAGQVLGWGCARGK